MLVVISASGPWQIGLYSLLPYIITGEYSCLKVDLLFRREFSYYLITIYIPCCMLVIVSWVSFWLDANAVPARVSLGVTTLLTMATQTTGINNSLPPVSYTKVSIISFHLRGLFKGSSILHTHTITHIHKRCRKGPGNFIETKKAKQLGYCNKFQWGWDCIWCDRYAVHRGNFLSLDKREANYTRYSRIFLALRCFKAQPATLTATPSLLPFFSLDWSY
jgi:hypothetical protein